MDKPQKSINQVVQEALGMEPEELIPITGEIQYDDTKGRAYLFTGSGIAGEGFADVSELDFTGETTGFAMTHSDQTKISRANRNIFERAADIINPAYNVEYLINIYYDDADYRAAVDTRSTATSGLGWRIEPLPWVESPDEAQKERLRQILSYPSNEMSTAEILVAINRDMLAAGFGCMEVERNPKASIEQSLNGYTYAPAYVTRQAKDEDLYYQIAGKTVTVFRKLGGKYENSPNAIVGVTRKTLPEEMGQALAFMTPKQTVQWNRRDPDLKLNLVDIRTEDYLVQEKTRVVSTNEILKFHRMAANDSYYGVPEIISAFRDYLAARYIREMNNNFFDNNTIPPLLVTCIGENLGPDDVRNIKSAIMKNRGKQAFHKAVYLELPMGAELKIEPLTQFIEKEGTHLQTLEVASEMIHRALRVPRTLTGVIEGVSGEAIEAAGRRFADTVAKPDQDLIEYRMNWMFNRYLGITDYRFQLVQLNLTSEREQAEIDDLYLRRAVIAPNDVRRRKEMPPLKGGESPTLTVPGVGVLVLEAVEELSKRVLHGDRLRDILLPRGTKTPAKGDAKIEVPEGQATVGDVIVAQLFLATLAKMSGSLATGMDSSEDS